MANLSNPATGAEPSRQSDEIRVEAVLVMGPAGAPPEATMRMTDPVIIPARVEAAATPMEPAPIEPAPVPPRSAMPGSAPFNAAIPAPRRTRGRFQHGI